jgi:type II secretory pathway pseudopilin PulG
MPAAKDEIERRRNVALNAIRQAFDTAADQHGATLFVSHHLEELGQDYWQKHCGTARPDSKQVLDILTLRSHWGDDDDDGIDTFDFSLPDNVTNYVISVSFDDNGDVTGITMESWAQNLWPNPRRRCPPTMCGR